MTSLRSLFSCLALVGLSGDMALNAGADQVLKIAMCQIVALDGDREGNFVRIEAALRAVGAKQIVLDGDRYSTRHALASRSTGSQACSAA